jgi:two-component system LytT family response regulator
MDTIRVLVVDDEKPARDRLRRLLARAGGVELVDSCAGGDEAVRVVREAATAGTPVHVLFLDVQMPEVDGFAVMSALVASAPRCPIPDVVFVTAHDDYAIRAFDARAIDYLLKPYSDERFHAALDRAVRQVRAGHAQAVMSSMRDLLAGTAYPRPGGVPLRVGTARRTVLDKILVKGTHRVRLIAVDQIRWIEADGMYVKLHTRDGASHLHRALLGTLDRSLDGRRFVRVHRSAIVNIEMVEEVRQDRHGEHILVLRDKTELRVGRRFRDRLQARLGQSL